MMTARCPWYIAGPLLDLLIVSLRAAVNKPLGALGGYIDIVDRATRSRRLGALILRPYYYDDHGCAAYVFGCGTLGQCAVGRPDLPGRARENAAELYTSLHEKLLRRWNPMLSLDRDAFIEALANVPAKPDEMEQILAFNRGHAEMKVQA